MGRTAVILFCENSPLTISFRFNSPPAKSDELARHKIPERQNALSLVIIYYPLIEIRKVVVPKQLVNSGVLIAFHIAVRHIRVFCRKDLLAHRLIDHPLYLSDVYIPLLLRHTAVERHGIETQQIEADTVWHDIHSVHHLELLLRIAIFWLPVQWEILSKILVETDANGVVAYDDALV